MTNIYVLVRRDGRFFARGNRWVSSFRSAAKLDKELAMDLFRNMPIVKGVYTSEEIRQLGMNRAPKRNKYKRRRKRRGRYLRKN